MTDCSAITRLARQWMDAWVARDRSALEGFLAPDYELVGAAFAGRSFGRSEWLETAVGRYRAERCTFSGPVVRQIAPGPPAVAAMSAIWTQVAHWGDNDLSGRYWITDIWREGGRYGWEVVQRSSVALDSFEASHRALGNR
jgi:hypothetical protein